MAIEIVDLPIKNGGSFHSFLYVYQRVHRIYLTKIQQKSFKFRIVVKVQDDFSPFPHVLKGLFYMNSPNLAGHLQDQSQLFKTMKVSWSQFQGLANVPCFGDFEGKT